MFTKVKTPSEIKAMRESGMMLATVLNELQRYVKPEMTTKQIADRAAEELKTLGGKPAFLGYQGFPDVICISINDEVVHGIPRHDKIIYNGDIVSLDFGVVYEGMISDGAISFVLGSGLPMHQQLVDTTKQSLYAGINVVKDKIRTGDIGNAIQTVLNKKGYGIVRDLVGHGVGHNLHEDPNIPNYGNKHTGSTLSKNMTVAIEPMATLGSHEVFVAEDGWTILTADGSWSAHFEHTVLITEDDAEILTEL